MDPTLRSLAELVDRAHQRGVQVDVVGDGTVAGRRLPPLLPGSTRPELRPLLEIIPAQLLAAEIAVQRGLDPDSPRGLSKVTLTY